MFGSFTIGSDGTKLVDSSKAIINLRELNGQARCFCDLRDT